ncbi:lytic transglycosylase domain-containing protein [Pedobacter punctiformis]|uniref:Lytic transglycosylase domain-containing protein n=1 Tax=Pedobacter punctiformis TaxID=3004097 RepID=A0ABT4L395_9SPHI|nr:lytic transglycosylase domain-containing protein [Pedobacter sp. HCMS5-2]MCZ4242385.1 lytic transglycosylase domain-containing protein [Pedobacter sp. HCMS5-2]
MFLLNVNIKLYTMGLLMVFSWSSMCAQQVRKPGIADTTFVSAYGLNYPQEISQANKIYIENYINRYEKRYAQLKKKNNALLNFFSHALATHGIPKELGALAVIESELENKSISKAGAVGPWQFMQTEATAFGLQNKDKIDERTDFYKSTYAACKLLKELHQDFGDWLLVVAAYNCGPGRVKRAMAQNDSRSFWKIENRLPKETRDHVKKFISVSYIINNRLPDNWIAEKKAPLKTKESSSASYLTCSVSTGYSLAIIAKKLQLTYKQLTDLNPDFEIKRSMQSSYLLKIPKDKMPDFYLYKDEILKESIEEMINKTDN